MKKLEFKSIDLVKYFTSIFGVLAILASIILLVYKLFGHPFLYESLTAFILGIILLAIYYMVDVMEQLIEVITNYVGVSQGVVNIFKTMTENSATIKGINLDELSPEELDKLKENMPPFLQGMIDMMKDEKTPVEPQQPKKPLEQMSINELYQEMKKSADNNEFEKAAMIKKLIEEKESR